MAAILHWEVCTGDEKGKGCQHRWVQVPVRSSFIALPCGNTTHLVKGSQRTGLRRLLVQVFTILLHGQWEKGLGGWSAGWSMPLETRTCSFSLLSDHISNEAVILACLLSLPYRHTVIKTKHSTRAMFPLCAEESFPSRWSFWSCWQWL